MVDPLCEFANDDPSIVVCDNWEAVLDSVSQDRFRISIEIQESTREILDFACKIARDEEVGDCVLVVDELSLFFKRGEEAPDSIQGIVRFGRRENVSLLLISQRSYDCPIDLRSQLSDIFAFRSHEPRDIQHLGQMVGRNEAEKVLALRGHNHYHWDLTSNGTAEIDPDSVTEDELDEPKQLEEKHVERENGAHHRRDYTGDD